MTNLEAKTEISNIFMDAEISDQYVTYRSVYSDDVFRTIVNFCQETNQNLNLAVDIGCGPGNSTMGLCKYFEKVIGVDISETQIERAPKNLPNCQFRIGDAQNLTFLSDGSVDLVTAGLSLNLMPVQKVLAEADRVLRPGGTLALFGYHPPSSTDKQMNGILDESLRLLRLHAPNEFMNILRDYEDIDIPYPDTVVRKNVRVSQMMSYNGVNAFWPLLQRFIHAGGKDFENKYLHAMRKKMCETYCMSNISPDEPVFEMIYNVFIIMSHKPSQVQTES